MKVSRIFKVSLFIVASEVVGLLGSFFTVSSVSGWYSSLLKPTFSPPNWIFAPVWTILYALMGLSVFLVWEKGPRKKEVKNALILFVIQLFLNGIWSPIFFGKNDILLALVIIIILWVLILITMTKFYKINRVASYLLAPYLAWVTFASILNFSLWQLNKGF